MLMETTYGGRRNQRGLKRRGCPIRVTLIFLASAWEKRGLHVTLDGKDKERY